MGETKNKKKIVHTQRGKTRGYDDAAW